jgi:O-antigen/teichoic acid export membrane protein|uniref:lipopolysaccharide biosynthesis protein n=1 Tax=Prosthecobacter sp. TaxID=1965333 RepID=UPI0037831C7C
MSLGKHLLRGSGMNMLDLVVKTLAMFFVTPLLIRSLGQSGYGSWLLVMSVVGYFLMIDMGVSFSATRFLAVALGRRDSGRQGTILTACRQFYRMASLVVVVLTFGLMPLLPWLTSHPENISQLYFALGLTGCVTALRFYFRLPMIVLRAHVRYDLQAQASLCRVVLQATVMCWALTHGATVLHVAVIHSCGECVELGLQAFFSRKLDRHLRSDASVEETKATRSELFAYSRSIIAGSFGDSMRLQLNPFLIAQLQGVNHIPAYSVGTRLITILEDAVNALFGGQLLSAFGQLHGADEPDKLRSQYLRVTHITSGFSAAAMAGVVFLAGPFLQSWVGESLASAHLVLMILSVPYVIHFMQFPAYNLLYTVGKTHWIVWLCFIGGLCSAALSLVLGLRYGMIGVVLGSGIEMFISRGLVMAWFVHRCTGISAAFYLFGHVLWPGFKGALFPTLFAWATFRFVTPDYSAILLFAAGYGAVFFLSFPWMVMDGSARRLIWKHLPVVGSRGASA